MLSSIAIQSWESVYVLFVVPGLILWIAGVIWSLRKSNIRGAVLLQVLGAVEVMAGAGVAFISGLNFTVKALEKAEVLDPTTLLLDYQYFAQIGFIGFVAHWVMLLVTLMIVIRVIRKNHKITGNI